MKFERWLETQTERDDTTGDLAKDYITAKNLYRNPYATYPNNKHSNNIIESMKLWKASSSAYESLERAITEYKKDFPDSNLFWTEDDSENAIKEQLSMA